MHRNILKLVVDQQAALSPSKTYTRFELWRTKELVLSSENSDKN
ncbi:1064_t:CDS:2 [Gigaspora margarita]|uniref:1064_t:CDS:1 n=1 Tax=Gigaspora margarita TaxID=4874 RepID=A0ABN7UPT1_GIGMA|nr:1064_t:CDS:2 [Gigaspora margarita]